MRHYYRLVRSESDQSPAHGRICGLVFLTLISCFVQATPSMADEPIKPAAEREVSESTAPVESGSAIAAYKWNLNDAQRPLLNLADQVKPDIDLSLTYPLGHFAFPLFQALDYDERSGKYILQLVPNFGSRAHFVDLQPSGSLGNYASTDGSNLYLSDNKGVKTVRTSDATEYTFVRFTDGTDRCVTVKAAGGSIISLVYTRENLIHCLIDDSGRILEFNYEDHHLASITQTWKVNSVLVSRNWSLGPRSDRQRSDSVRACKLVTTGGNHASKGGAA